jgi:hypothetical protein
MKASDVNITVKFQEGVPFVYRTSYYSLRARRFEDRFPMRARFSATVQTGPGVHLASYTMGTGSLPGVKRPGRGVDHPPHLEPKLKKE